MTEKINRVYFPDKVGSEKDIPSGMEKSSFRIVKNQFIEMEFGSKSAYILMLDLIRAENKEDKPFYVYALKGVELISNFLSDSGIDLHKAKNGPIEELVGKEVIGFVPREVKENAYPTNIDKFVKAIKIKENREEGK